MDTECGYPQIYVSIIINKLVELRQSGELKKPVNVYIDEAHAFIPAEGDPSSKKAIKDIINVHRQLGFAVRLYTQLPKQLPPDIISQLTHFYLPYNVDMEILTFIARKIGWWRTRDAFNGRWNDIKEVMEKFWWMYLNRNDTNRREVKLLKLAAPLCKHKEEKRF